MFCLDLTSVLVQDQDVFFLIVWTMLIVVLRIYFIKLSRRTIRRRQ